MRKLEWTCDVIQSRVWTQRVLKLYRNRFKCNIYINTNVITMYAPMFILEQWTSLHLLCSWKLKSNKDCLRILMPLIWIILMAPPMLVQASPSLGVFFDILQTESAAYFQADGPASTRAFITLLTPSICSSDFTPQCSSLTDFLTQC